MREVTIYQIAQLHSYPNSTNHIFTLGTALGKKASQAQLQQLGITHGPLRGLFIGTPTGYPVGSSAEKPLGFEVAHRLYSHLTL